MGERVKRHDPNLEKVGTYRRTVRASLPRVWENVFDWEHLPALHAQDFRAIELLDRGPWGWRARVTAQGSKPRAQTIELRADRRSGFYRVTTLAGPGIGSEVHTTLFEKSSRRTGIEVEFLVPANLANRTELAGRYVEIYERLWDQDEAMMMRRERIFRARRKAWSGRERARTLGPIERVRARLPLIVSFGGERFRVVESDGELVAHAVTCPHWWGPLDASPVVDGCIRCPWHGYEFDIRSGASADGRDLALGRAPLVVLRDGNVRLEPRVSTSPA